MLGFAPRVSADHAGELITPWLQEQHEDVPDKTLMMAFALRCETAGVCLCLHGKAFETHPPFRPFIRCLG